MDNLLKDIRYALRTLRKSPGFTIAAILTLALGIGSNTARFSVIPAVLLRPLPFPEPDRIMQVASTTQIRKFSSESYPDFFDYRQRNRSFAYLSAYHSTSKTLTGIGEAQHIEANVVTPGFFEALGVQPTLGRTFRPEEEKPGNRVAILSDSMWRNVFHGDPAILGKPIILDGKPHTVVGVMPEGFQFPITAKARDIWISSAEDGEIETPGDTPSTAQRGAHFLRVVGRLKPGVTPEQAEQDIASIVRALKASIPPYVTE